jgi:hypothetical protein
MKVTELSESSYCSLLESFVAYRDIQERNNATNAEKRVVDEKIMCLIRNLSVSEATIIRPIAANV